MSSTGPGLTVRSEEAEALAWVMLAELSGTVPVPRTPPSADPSQGGARPERRDGDDR